VATNRTFPPTGAQPWPRCALREAAACGRRQRTARGGRWAGHRWRVPLSHPRSPSVRLRVAGASTRMPVVTVPVW